MKTRSIVLALALSPLIGTWCPSTTNAQAETTKIAANFDENGNCTDFVAGYGKILQPTDGFWVFTTQNDTTYLQGLPFDPIRKIGKDGKPLKRWKYDPEKVSQAFKDSISNKFDLDQAAVEAFEASGLAAAAEVYRNSPLVLSAVPETDNFLIVTYTDKSWTEKKFISRQRRLEAEFKRSNPLPKRDFIKEFEDALKAGNGWYFGTQMAGLVISSQLKDDFEQALFKLMNKEELSTQDRSFLPMGNRGFIHDISDK